MIATVRATIFIIIGAIAASPTLAQFDCTGTVVSLDEATAVSGSTAACYHFNVPTGSPFVRLHVKAGDDPVDLYFSAGRSETLTDWDRMNASPVKGDAKFVLLEPSAGDYTVAVDPKADAARFSLQATTGSVASGDEPKTVCVGDICSTTLPMLVAAQAVELGPTFGDRVIFPITVSGPGKIEVEANWSGSANRLALLINGPNRPELSNPVAYYARRDSGSPVKLSYAVTADDVKRGRRFRVSLVNFSGGTARGDVKITKPEQYRFNVLPRPAFKQPLVVELDVESACFNHVQGEIAWDYEGHKQWNPSNAQRLCRGSSNAAEPAKCFKRVMHGSVNWGGGTRWKWENAIDLCEGTNSSRRTVACFQRKIQAGNNWRNAIHECDSQ